MADENYSTYQWVPDINGRVNSSGLNIPKSSTLETITGADIPVTVNITITHTNIFALIAGTYQVKVVGVANDDNGENIEVYCTCNINEPKLCSKEGEESYKIDLILSGKIERGPSIYSLDYNFSCQSETFEIQQGIDNEPNKYLCILQKPKLITSLTIDNNKITDKTYVEGSSIPIDKIKNISTKDFHNIKINSDEGLDIFHKLVDDNKIGVNIETNVLDIPELTVVNLPESKRETIYICKSRSKNKGITFKTSDPDISTDHFGYIMYIQSCEAAGYNSFWVNRETLNEMFEGMPDDIMSTTAKFEYTGGFRLHKLTYKEINVTAPDWVNNEDQHFTESDINELKKHAPTYYKGTINESTSDVDISNNMLLKNIEFVKFGEKVIKLNYKPLYEA